MIPAAAGHHPGRNPAALAVSDKEYVLSCRFAAPVERPGDPTLAQECGHLRRLDRPGRLLPGER